jgi:hypothetical protein
MFPNGAGRLAEMITGLGLSAVGTALYMRNGGTFDDIRGMLEGAIGATSLLAGTVDILVTESESEEDTTNLESHDEFMSSGPDTEESKKLSGLTAIPRYMRRTIAALYNDNKILEQFADIQDKPDLLDIFQNDPVRVKFLTDAAARRAQSLNLTNTFRSVAGSIINDFKELGDHFGEVLSKIRSNDNDKDGTLSRLKASTSILMDDVKSAPARYAGAVQLAGAQLFLPLAAFTAVGGMMTGKTTVEKAGFLVCGAWMTTSWFFKHRGCAAKTRMTLRGITVGEDGDGIANDNIPAEDMRTLDLPPQSSAVGSKGREPF